MNHTVSLELSKQLKEKGFSQETEFYWYEIPVKDNVLPHLAHKNNVLSTEMLRYKVCAAPLLSEVLEQMPNRTEIYKNEKGEYEANDYSDDEYYSQEDHNSCDAAAKLWLQLKQEGII